ncbi:MAG: thymidine phosphorylase [Candidatus Velthaea sp.]
MDQGWLRRAIERKRDGGTIERPQWAQLIRAYTAGEIDDAPVAALAMACLIRGMSGDEIVALTDAMIASGERIEIGGERIVVDKHSSGGVGDTISLAVVPIVAACGVPVAKLSGRALGHTGGTLDKLEAIPGVRTDLSPAQFVSQIERIGCAIAAQSDRLVPADKKLYALRDRTATVPSVGLIAASIVSKKIAGGAGAIVFDVKLGGGAFMRTRERALELATTLVDLAQRLGRRASAVVTDMDEPLAANIGTGIEALEARDFLRAQRREGRFAELTRIIAHEMLRVGGVPQVELDTRYAAALASGAAYERFVSLIEAQGGSRAALEQMDVTGERSTVAASADGYIGTIDAVAIGEAARELVAASGPFAGIRIAARVGTPVRRGERVAEIAGAADVAARVAGAFTIVPEPPRERALVEAVIRDAAERGVSNAARE